MAPLSDLAAADSAAACRVDRYSRVRISEGVSNGVPFVCSLPFRVLRLADHEHDLARGRFDLGSRNLAPGRLHGFDRPRQVALGKFARSASH